MLFAIVVPLLVLPVALQSPFLAAAFAFALLILISSASFGLEHTGGAILLAAFAASPLDDLRPISALSFVAVSDLLFAIAFMILAPAFLGRSLQVPSLFVLGGIGMLSSPRWVTKTSPQASTTCCVSPWERWDWPSC